MKAKDYLSQIQKLDVLIENKVLEIMRWKEAATNITGFVEGEKVQTSGSKQKMADAVCECIDRESVLREEIGGLESARKEITQTIDLLPRQECELLYKVYVLGKELKQTAAEMDRSYSTVTSLHGKALVSIQKILDERERSKSETGQAGQKCPCKAQN